MREAREIGKLLLTENDCNSKTTINDPEEDPVVILLLDSLGLDLPDQRQIMKVATGRSKALEEN